MRAGAPDTALKAIAWRYLLVSGWPWRSAGYLLVTLPAAAVAAAGLAIPAVPWIVLAKGGFQPTGCVALVLLGAALIAALGPLVTIPAMPLGRWRLRMTDTRPLCDRPRLPPPGGLAAWLRARYTDQATWRELGYACLLATVVPALAVVALASGMISVACIISPFLVLTQKPDGTPVTLIAGDVTTTAQTLPYAIIGILLLPLVPYLVTLVAGADSAMARALLLSGSAEELRADLTEVSRSRARLADAFEAERHRIERDLHDGAQQKLVSLTMRLGLAGLDLTPGSPAAATVAAAHEQAKQLMAELRELIRGIQPQVLTDRGLAAAFDDLADSSAVPVTVSAHLEGRLPRQVENTAYFAVAEALTNVTKHSGATQVTVPAQADDHMLIVEVIDDGHGGADPALGSGLTGLADRVAAADGRMLLSSPPGGPTVLRVEVPCHQSPSG